MYTKVEIAWSKVIKFTWKGTLFIALYSVGVYLLYDNYGFQGLSIPLSVAMVLGTAISLLLGFRTNAAYDRWWEARKVWGAIVNDSRTLVRQANSFIDREIPTKTALVEKLAKQQIAWCYALTASLREQDVESQIKPYLDEEDFTYVMKQSNKHTAIQQAQGIHLAEIHAMGGLDSFQFTAMDNTLSSLCNSMGMGERIKKTTFPVQYDYFTRVSVFILMILLPFGLVGPLGIFSIPVTIIVIFFFGMISNIARYMQDPFENRPTDTAMTAISRTIEVNLLQLAENGDVPDMIQPDEHGVLM